MSPPPNRKQYDGAGSLGLWEGGGWTGGLFPGGICLASDGGTKKAASGQLVKCLDRRVSRIEEHNQTPDIYPFFFFTCKPKAYFTDDALSGSKVWPGLSCVWPQALLIELCLCYCTRPVLFPGHV